MDGQVVSRVPVCGVDDSAQCCSAVPCATCDLTHICQTGLWIFPFRAFSVLTTLSFHFALEALCWVDRFKIPFFEFTVLESRLGVPRAVLYGGPVHVQYRN